MTKDEAKQAYGLVSLYIALYKNKYKKVPLVNKYRDKWAMQDVIDTVGYERARILMDYYFKCSKPGHPLNWFLYNFDKLDDTLLKSEQDLQYRKDVFAQTKNMVEREDFEH